MPIDQAGLDAAVKAIISSENVEGGVLPHSFALEVLQAYEAAKEPTAIGVEQFISMIDTAFFQKMKSGGGDNLNSTEVVHLLLPYLRATPDLAAIREILQRIDNPLLYETHGTGIRKALNIITMMRSDAKAALAIIAKHADK